MGVMDDDDHNYINYKNYNNILNNVPNDYDDIGKLIFESMMTTKTTIDVGELDSKQEEHNKKINDLLEKERKLTVEIREAKHLAEEYKKEKEKKDKKKRLQVAKIKELAWDSDHPGIKELVDKLTAMVILTYADELSRIENDELGETITQMIKKRKR